MYENNENNNYDYNQPGGAQYNAPSAPPVYTPPQSEPSTKEKGLGRKFVAAALIAVLGCSSLGVGIGFGGGLYNNLAEGKAEGEPIAQAEAVIPEEKQIPKITFAPQDELGEPSAQAQPSMEVSNMVLATGDLDVVSVIKEVSNSVVSINVSTTYRDIFNRTMELPSAGSGIICAEDAANIYIVTNYHVIEAAGSVEISIDDDKSVAASPVGSDAENDIAVISVSKADLIGAEIDDYKIATFGDAQIMEVGETVIAIGNALGEGKSATLGIISAKNKHITVETSNYVDVIQTDASINRGNSGGALVNLKGQVIGVNTAKLAAAGVEGMGYAIPSNTVKNIVDTLMEEGSVERPFIGITGSGITDAMKERYALPSLGIYVMEISAGSGARDGGLKAGDIITSFNGIPVLAMEKLQEEVAKTQVGDMAEVKIFRDDTELTLTIEMRDANAHKSF